jgi:hypothetical protein
MMMLDTKKIIVALLLLTTSSHAQPPTDCIPQNQLERIREIMLDGIDMAFKEHIAHLLSVLIKDPKDQPDRAIAGLRPAIKAYVNGRIAVVNWNPATCEERNDGRN